MAIIQFENGTRVDFDGTPTAQDVEEVARSLQPAAPVKPKTSLVQKAKDARSAFEKGQTNALAATGNFLGMGPLGTGLGGAVLGQFLPEVSAARKGITAEQQATAGLPAETLRRMAREGKPIQNSDANRTLEQGLTNDLTNKQVIGSAAATGLLATGGSIASGIEGASAPLAGTGTLSRLLPQIISGATLGGAQAGAVSASRNKDNKDIGKDILIGATIGGAMPLAFEGGKWVLKQTGKGAATMSGLLTGQGGAATQEEFKRGLEGDSATIREYMGRSPKEIAETGKRAVDTIRDARNSLYQQDLAKIATNTGELDLTPVQDSIKEKLITNIRAQITKDGVDFSGSRIANQGSKDVIESAYNTIQNWDDFTPVGLDSLKQQLSDIAGGAIPKSPAQQFVIDASNQVGNLLDDHVPGYAELVSNYTDSSKAIQEAQQIFGLKNPPKGSMNYATAWNKLSRVYRDNQDLQLQALKDLSERSGVDLAGMVLGAQGGKSMPTGLIGRGALGFAGTAMLPGGVPGIPSVLGTLLATSPRIATETALRSGQLTGLLQQLAQSSAGQGAGRLVPQLVGSAVGNR